MFKKWNLKINSEKTERTKIDINDTSWKNVKKLGSLLDTQQDIYHRCNLAHAAFAKLRRHWSFKIKISNFLKIRLYKIYVLPILTYNIGTWSLNATLASYVDIFHRKQLRQLLNVKWTDKMTSNELYKISKSVPLSTTARSTRWRLFGHILRLHENVPAYTCMVDYFSSPEVKRKGQPQNNLVSVLQMDCKRLDAFDLKSLEDLEYLRSQAQDRFLWKKIVEQISLN